MKNKEEQIEFLKEKITEKYKDELNTKSTQKKSSKEVSFFDSYICF